MLEFCVLFFAWLLGSFVNAISGMGAAVIALPLISLVVPIDVLIPVSCIAGCSIAIYLSIRYFKYTYFNFLLPMMLGSVPGTYLGINILLWISKDWLQIILGVLLLIYAYWQITLKVVTSHPTNKIQCVLIGVVSAFSQAATSVGGPPAYAYSVYAGWERKAAIATLSFYTAITSIFVIPGQYYMGLYTENTLYYAGVSLLGVCTGLLLGAPIAKRISAKNYRLLVIIIIFVSGLLCTMKGLYGS